ncbi:hypothetical protein Taro_017013 [Colocasia esculenta]|uniref:Retrotransposon gag domain-containing protein n=1 Tax=Colocasia esculenta TaxID=4460 RepID=A0A843URX6_COLES|nr:hypothetical protein [Colocasia esculenta]
MAGVRFGPLVVQDHARYGYLAVPTKFGSFPPVVEFPNFLGVAFVDILHPEIKKEAEAGANRQAKDKEITKELSCHVHHVERGPVSRSKGKRVNVCPPQVIEAENIVTRRARVSTSGKSVRIGDLRIHLQAKKIEAVPERVTTPVPVKNSFQALAGKREMANTFKGKVAPKPVKFKQVWRPKRTQKNKVIEVEPREEEALREAVAVEIPTRQRPPRGFKTRVQQGGACAYAHFHDKRRELRRSAHIPTVRRGRPTSAVLAARQCRREEIHGSHDHMLGLVTSPLQRSRPPRVRKDPQAEAESSSGENDVPCESGHEQPGGAKPRVSVFKRLTFPSRRVERGRHGNLTIFSCHVAGVWGRYGALPTENEELIELAERPGVVTRRRAAAAALAAAYGLEDVPTIQMTVSANVVTAQGSGGNDDIPPPPPPPETSGGTSQQTPFAAPIDPAIMELLQQYQAEIADHKRQIKGPPVAIINTPNNQPAHFYPQQVDPTTVSKLMLEQMIDMRLAERGDGEQMAFDAYRVPYPAHHAAKRLPPGITKAPKFDKFNGRGSPKEHIAYYINVMGDLAADESYLLKFFGSSLTGLAFEWYSSLPAGSISDWTDMQKKFRERFYIAEREVTVAELYATRQKNDESALDYIQRWRNLSMRCKRPPHQEDAVQICKQNLKRELLERMIGVEIRSFDRLNNVVAEIEAFLVKYPTNSFASQKTKPADKKPAGKEVHAVDLKTFEKQRDEGKAAAGTSSNKAEPKRKVIPFQDKMRKPYSFPKEKTKTLFDWGIRYNKITLPTPKRPDQAAKKDEPRYCLYHQILGHPLEECYVFKDIVESLIKKGELQMGDYRVDTPQPHELPARQAGANMISIYQQLPEEISEASTENAYKSLILTPSRDQEEWQKVPTKAKKKPKRKPAPKVHIRGVTPQPPAPVVTPVWHPIEPRVVIQRNPGNRRRRTPLPLYGGGSPSLERLQALIDELDEYEQPNRYPVRLQEYVPWEELEKLTLEIPAEQETPQPQEDLFWGQEPTKKKKKRRSKKKKVVTTLSCNTISSLLGLGEHYEEEEFYPAPSDVNQVGASGQEFVTRSGKKWGRVPPANQNIIFRGEPSYKIPEPETGGTVPSLAEFLAAEENTKALSRAPILQRKVDDEEDSPVTKPQANNGENDKGKSKEILSLSEETRRALIAALQAPTQYETCLAEVQVEAAVINAESITFTPEDMLLPTATHNRPLYMRGQLNGQPLNRILVDPEAAVNILPYKIYQKYHFDVHLTSVHDVRIAGFNQKFESAVQDREAAQRQMTELRSELERVRGTGAGGASSSRSAGGSPSLMEAQLTGAVLRAEEAQRHLEEWERDLKLAHEHAMTLQSERDQLRIRVEAAEAQVAEMTRELATLRVQKPPKDQEEVTRLRAELLAQQTLARSLQQIVTDIGRSRSRSRSGVSVNRATGASVGQYLAGSSSRRRNEEEERRRQGEGSAHDGGGGGEMLPPPDRREGSGESGGGQ